MNSKPTMTHDEAAAEANEACRIAEAWDVKAERIKASHYANPRRRLTPAERATLLAARAAAKRAAELCDAMVARCDARRAEILARRAETMARRAEILARIEALEVRIAVAQAPAATQH